MTAWLSNSNLVNNTRLTRGGNMAVLYAALALVAAIALFLVISAGLPIAQDTGASLAGP
jgi:hypothetical protein